MQRRQKISIIAVCSVLFLGSMVLYPSASAESLPQWIKNTALWYGEGLISETEFLIFFALSFNLMKYICRVGKIIKKKKSI